jgi:hypothetical protein
MSYDGPTPTSMADFDNDGEIYATVNDDSEDTPPNSFSVTDSTDCYYENNAATCTCTCISTFGLRS